MAFQYSKRSPRPFSLLFSVITCLALLAITAQPAYAKKSFFEAMFGWMSEKPDEGPDPAETLIAPFAYSGKDKAPLQAQTNEQKASPIPLRHAHTNEEEIGKWLITAVSDAMSYTVGEPTDVVEANSKYFARSGQERFRDFLVQNNIQKVIDSGRFNIRSFVREQPLLLNSGTANDRFRWLYEVPIMVSYMDAENFNYKEDEPVNQHIVLTLQVGRFANVDDPENIFDVMIETWAGKTMKVDKK